MKKVRFLVRLIGAFLTRHKYIVLCGFIGGIIFFLFLPRIFSLIPLSKKTEVIGIAGRFNSEEIPLEIQNLASYGLTKIEKDGSPAPALASGWNVEADGKIYTFILRDAFWQDNTKVSAQDINYNFKDVKIEILDVKTIRFTLKEPFSPFPVIVSRPIFKKGLTGLGQYKIEKITKSGQYLESVTLKSLNSQAPDLKYRFYPTEESAKMAFKLGEVRVLKNLTNIFGFEDWRNIQIIPKIRYDQYVGLFLNTSKSLLQEKTFRQALSYAIEKKEGNSRAIGPISPKSWAYNDEVKQYNQDFTNARKLLDKTFGGKHPELIIKITTVSSLLAQADEIKNSWEKLGIKVDIDAFTSLENDFDALLVTQEISSDPDQYSFWHSTQDSNITEFKNPKIDKLLEDGRKTLNREERRNIYFDFQRFLVEEVPAIFLYHPTVYDLSRK